MENKISTNPTSDENQSFVWMLDEYAGNVYISDMENYELLYLNKVSCESLGHTYEEVIGKKCYEVIQGRATPCPFCTNDRITYDEFYEWEFYNKFLDRTFIIKNRIVNWNGRRARLELSHDNYSSEYKLSKKDRELDAMLRTIPGGMIRIDARDYNKLLWYSNKFLSIIGYSKTEYEKELRDRRDYIHPEDKPRVFEMMDKARETEESVIMEIRIITHSGETRIVTATISYVKADESWDDIPSFYSLGIDTTKEHLEQARQRQFLEDAYQTAKIASDAKTNFLSTMSHDIRTPMNAIIGMMTILSANTNSPEIIKDCIYKINSSSKHLLSLINEVLDMSKIESGKINLILEETNLADMVQEVSDMCRPLISAKNQNFSISVNSLEHEWVIVDSERLKQVLVNLLSNANKYTPEGGNIVFGISELYSEQRNKSQYEFCIADNGIGMSKEFLARAFEPFARSEDSRISKIQGTGLGLTIADNIIRMVNGTIQVQSEPEAGTKFTVTVPLEWSQKDDENDLKLAGLSILVVDDDEVVCENAVKILEKLGITGRYVLSGKDAIACVVEANKQNQPFFAIILDWIMPGMDGLKVVKRIRGILGNDIPIIIISAYDYSEVEADFIEAGADAFISKPLFKSKLLYALQTLLSSEKKHEAIKKEKVSSLADKRILLAEDNELNSSIVVKLLEMYKMHVDTAENGKKSVELFENSAPGTYSAILMDIQMPVMNGYEATSIIRSLKRSDAKKIPIIALTANVFSSDIAKTRSVGMNEHIAKPIEVEHMIETLQKCIAESSLS